VSSLYASSTTPAAGFTQTDIASIVVLPDGKILTVGQHGNPSTPGQLFLTQFEESGTPDLTLAPAGSVLHPTVESYPRGLLVQPDGAIGVLDPPVASLLRVWL